MLKFVVACALTAAAVAAPATAVTVVGATRIVVTNAIPTWLQVAEVQAVSFGAVNVAAAANGGTASGSAEYQNNGFATPDKAIDGNTGGNYYSDTIYHSGTTGGDQFLQVLFAPTTLASLTIYGRTDCCHNRDIYGYAIYAGEVLLTSGTLDTTGAPSGTVKFDAPVNGVPEPATWGLMLAGFAMVGVAARRRSTRTVAA